MSIHPVANMPLGGCMEQQAQHASRVAHTLSHSIPCCAGTAANGVTSSSFGSWGASFRFTPITRLLCNSTNVGATPIVTAANPVQTVSCPRGCTAKINAGPVYGNKASQGPGQGPALQPACSATSSLQAALPPAPSLLLRYHMC